MNTHSEEYWRKILPPDSARRAAGRWVIGDAIGSCEVIQILGGPGKSGMGIVYVCHDYVEEETVAIKTFQNRFLEDPTIIERFKWEAETWVRLGKHTNIVEAKRVENHAGKPHIYLEYVVGDERYGSSLSGWIHNGGLFRNGKPDMPLILDFAIRFCHGMIHAEKRFYEMGKPFVHRDIKPANILVTRDKVVKVTDFGLVKAFADLDQDIPLMTVEDGVSRRLSVSKSGAVCGTPPYMSPEQCLGYANIDVRSDIYAFGCVLYEMLTGRLVFDCRTPDEFIRHHLQVRPNSPNVLRDLDTVVLKCLEKKPANRYADF
ncbi:MAG: serine/threonine protein kinase, partial [Desulfobacteraceae bacterium]|nr:serine/threonine protein kinase [Desulfobacteraceae bacterium]